MENDLALMMTLKVVPWCLTTTTTTNSLADFVDVDSWWAKASTSKIIHGMTLTFLNSHDSTTINPLDRLQALSEDLLKRTNMLLHQFLARPLHDEAKSLATQF